jgi:hypothetical protein
VLSLSHETASLSSLFFVQSELLNNENMLKFENDRKMPHVHFQLSSHPPDTHDMPGAVSIEDRPRALLDYPDPRLVLGPLY